MEKMDIHGYQQSFESTLEKVRSDKAICKENKEDIIVKFGTKFPNFIDMSHHKV